MKCTERKNKITVKILKEFENMKFMLDIQRYSGAYYLIFNQPFSFDVSYSVSFWRTFFDLKKIRDRFLYRKMFTFGFVLIDISAFHI